MGFIFRAVFWLAVVAAFMPRTVADERDAAPRVEIADGSALIDAAASAAEFCTSQPEVCAAGAEAASLAADIGGVAAESARDALILLGEQS
jgi:hypothetical protein